MALGRPAMVSNLSSDLVSLPKEVDEEAFQRTSQADEPEIDAEIPEVPVSLLSFFIHSTKLCDIIQDVLSSFYADGCKAETPSLASYFIGSGSVFELDNRLTEWYTSIPPHIQLDYIKEKPLDGREIHWICLRQAVVLKLRFLQTRLYLLRPVLAKVCTAGRVHASEMPSGLLERTAIQCSFVCIKAAIDLIEVANDHQTTVEHWGQKPSWLYGILHVYLAATVLLAARLAPATTLGEISDDEIQKSWEHALQLLRGFQSDSLSAQRCVAALEVLYRKLPGNRSANETTFQPLNSLQPTIPYTQELAQMLPTNESIKNDIQFWSADSPEWTANFDFSDPYDMSWFQIAPDMNFA